MNDINILRPGRSDLLKLIACVTMLIDHIAAVFLTVSSNTGLTSGYYMIMREIGRTAFPIFAYGVAVGIANTRDAKRYTLRLLVFAIISQLPFVCAFSPGQRNYLSAFDISKLREYAYMAFLYPGTNVMVTFFLAVLPFALAELIPEGKPREIAKYALMLGAVYAAEALNTDYGAMGVLLVYIFYLSAKSLPVSIAAVTVFFAYWIYFGGYQIGLYCIPALVLIYLPFILNNTGLYPPFRLPKYFFYAFYPTHLTILAVLAAIL